MAERKGLPLSHRTLNDFKDLMGRRYALVYHHCGPRSRSETTMAGQGLIRVDQELGSPATLLKNPGFAGVSDSAFCGEVEAFCSKILYQFACRFASARHVHRVSQGIHFRDDAPGFLAGGMAMRGAGCLPVGFLCLAQPQPERPLAAGRSAGGDDRSQLQEQ